MNASPSQSFFLMISLCISNFSLSRCQKWEKVPTLPRIDHTHSQKGPIAIQLFFFAHQTYGTLLGSLLWALVAASNDDQLEHSFNEQEAHLSLFSKLASTAFALFEHNSHTSPHMSGHWYKSILYLYEKSKKDIGFVMAKIVGFYVDEVGRGRDGQTYLDTSATMSDFAIKPL